MTSLVAVATTALPGEPLLDDGWQLPVIFGGGLAVCGTALLRFLLAVGHADISTAETRKPLGGKELGRRLPSWFKIIEVSVVGLWAVFVAIGAFDTGAGTPAVVDGRYYARVVHRQEKTVELVPLTPSEYHEEVKGEQRLFFAMPSAFGTAAVALLLVAAGLPTTPRHRPNGPYPTRWAPRDSGPCVPPPPPPPQGS
ncbi:hypothetical protein HHX38_26215 [Streptomyces sp. PKU-MA01144]|uniref:hypothetical protein n=1 Tax=Streptomyces sp. PKU-MA01144 TaxID=2729138 RepID=UPI001480FB71|nr:hypothetical protein [Streptomyces sp. PKU-MA01144]NNJ07598.1 hypothetical protein [Streptomyces sp. PKU-MA01144]